MTLPKIQGRTLALFGLLIPLLGVFLWLTLTSGPLAPIPVTVISVTEHRIAPSLFGVGIVEARSTYRIGPTMAGRVRRVEVEVGDQVQPGQLLGEMDPVDLDDRVAAQEAALHRAESGVTAAQAQVRDAQARRDFASAQVHRYEQLLSAQTTSEDLVGAKRQEAQVTAAGLAAAQANLESAEQELVRVRAERAALMRQRSSLRLLAPVAGLVVSRDAEPGSTLVAGQSVVEVIDPTSLWIDARFDQLGAAELRPELSVAISLRSASAGSLTGQVLRIEPRADAITEELLAKVSFATLPDPLPRLGELAEVRVILAPLPPGPALPTAALHRRDGALGVWLPGGDWPRFVPVETGATDLDGWVRIRSGLALGDQVILHSQAPLSPRRRIRIVDAIPGVPQ